MQIYKFDISLPLLQLAKMKTSRLIKIWGTKCGERKIPYFRDTKFICVYFGT